MAEHGKPSDRTDACPSACLPFSWKASLLAVIPGVLAALGCIRADFSIWMLAGILALGVFLLAAWWWGKKRLPAWSLMALGMLTAILLNLVAGMLGAVLSILFEGAALKAVLIILIPALAGIVFFSLRGRHLSFRVVILFFIVLLGQLTVRLKFFILVGYSWTVAGDWLTISLYALVIALLFPVAFGLYPARRHGQAALLFVIGGVFVGFQVLIDVYGKVSGNLGNTFLFRLYSIGVPFLFTVAAPLAFLRLRSTRSRLASLLILAGLAVSIDLLVVGISYDSLPTIIWISFIPYTLSVLGTLTLAYILYTPGPALQKVEGPNVQDPG